MFFGKSKKNVHSCICDIGSDSVSVSFVCTLDGIQKPEIIWYKKISLSSVSSHTKEKLGPKGLVKYALREIITAAEDYRKKQKLNVPHNVLVSLASPWFISESHNEHLVYKDEHTFSETDFFDIVTKAGLSLEEKAKTKSNFLSHYFDSEAHVIEKNLINVKLNGYTIENPLGKQVHDLELDFFLSIIPSDLYEFIKDIFDTEWGSAKVRIASFPLIHYLVAKNTKQSLNNSLFVDITGSVTEVSKITDSAVVNIEHIPVGKSHFRKHIENQYNIGSFMANSLLDVYVQKKLSVQESANIDFLIKDTETRWKKEIADYITSQKKEGFGCTEYVVSADALYVEFFSKLLRESITPASDSTPECVPLITSIESYNDLVIWGQDSSTNPFLALCALFAIQNSLRTSL